MKNTLKFFGIVALIAIIGFTMAACGEDDGGGGTPSEIKFGDVPKDLLTDAEIASKEVLTADKTEATTIITELLGLVKTDYFIIYNSVSNACEATGKSSGSVNFSSDIDPIAITLKPTLKLLGYDVTKGTVKWNASEAKESITVSNFTWKFEKNTTVSGAKYAGIVSVNSDDYYDNKGSKGSLGISSGVAFLTSKYYGIMQSKLGYSYKNNNMEKFGEIKILDKDGKQVGDTIKLTEQQLDLLFN